MRLRFELLLVLSFHLLKLLTPLYLFPLVLFKKALYTYADKLQEVKADKEQVAMEMDVVSFNILLLLLGRNGPQSHGGHVESRGIENFCFAPQKLVPKNISTRGSGCEIYCL